MAGNHLVINVEFGETRVALIEDGVVVELYIERASERGMVGNVFLGRVERVLPGMQAAFVNIGAEKSAYLYVADIVRPEDFDALVPGERSVEPEVEPNGGENGGAAETEAQDPGDEGPSDDAGAPDADPDAGTEQIAADADADGGAEPAPADSEPQRPGGHRRGGRRRRGGGRAGDDTEIVAARRVSRRTPIRDLVKEGDEVLVQVDKGPISTKGARVTSHISLAGRCLVYMPTVDHVGVSRRIEGDKERKRLRAVLDQIRPTAGGVIARTEADGASAETLKADLDYLVRTWKDILEKRERARAPALLYRDLDLVLRTARDLFTKEVEKLVVDDAAEHAKLQKFVENFSPERVPDIEMYSGAEPIYDAYGIEAEITRALARKVSLKSGGSLIIDQTEALTSIDVNTGRFTGSKNLEETITKTNLEAVDEIAYQLRFRNLGGLIILDFIDMDRPSNRRRVNKALLQGLKHDKARTTTVRISELGLVEMTRKRTRESLGRTLHEGCFYCDGTGQLLSKTTICYEVLREIRRSKDKIAGYSIVVNVHPSVAEVLKTDERAALEEAQRRYSRSIYVNACPDYHLEQFDLEGRSK